MMPASSDQATVFTAVARAAARKRVYALRASRLGREAEARLLRVMAASEEVQARRLFHNLRGWIDLSENFLATVFLQEQEEVLAEYRRQLDLAREKGQEVSIQVLDQLRRAELRLQSFYNRGKGEITVGAEERFHLCPFCGFLGTGAPPEKCPICGAAGESFREID